MRVSEVAQEVKGVGGAEPRRGLEGDGACGRGGGARQAPAIAERGPHLRGLSTGRRRRALERRTLNGPQCPCPRAASGRDRAGPNIEPELSLRMRHGRGLPRARAQDSAGSGPAGGTVCLPSVAGAERARRWADFSGPHLSSLSLLPPAA